MVVISLNVTLNHNKQKVNMVNCLLQDHIMEKHRNEKKLICCEYCGKTFLTHRSCKRHVDSQHKKGQSASEKVCHICGRVFTSLGSFRHHMWRKHNKNRNPKLKIKCEDCAKVFLTRSGYMCHRTTHHLKPEDIDKYPGKLYKCPTCPKIFPRAWALKVHIKAHENEKSEICNICGKGFNYRGNLTEHMRIHEKQPHVCDTCGEKFTRRQSLVAHMEKHREKIRCEECKKVKLFKTKKHYYYHYVAKHLKYEDRDKFPLKVHACPKCRKLFISTFTLKSHVRSHDDTDKKLYGCEICGKRYNQKRGIKKHMKSHDSANASQSYTEIEDLGYELQETIIQEEGHQGAEGTTPEGDPGNSVPQAVYEEECQTSEGTVNIDLEGSDAALQLISLWNS